MPLDSAVGGVKQRDRAVGQWDSVVEAVGQCNKTMDSSVGQSSYKCDLYVDGYCSPGVEGSEHGCSAGPRDHLSVTECQCDHNP